jgi:hypothetical protein
MSESLLRHAPAVMLAEEEEEEELDDEVEEDEVGRDILSSSGHENGIRCASPVGEGIFERCF